MKPSLAETPARAAPVGAPPAAAAPAAAPSSESGLAAALREAGIADGKVPGAYRDAGGHSGCPWRSGIRRKGFEHVVGGRHASCAEASLRVLELLQAHPPFIEKDRFTLAAGRHVNAAQLARLVEAARADLQQPRKQQQREQHTASPGARTVAVPSLPRRRRRTADGRGRRRR